MVNAITVDVEDWYQTTDFNFDIQRWDSFEDRVEFSTRTILDTLSEHGIRATFFILGCVAKKHPSLVREIIEKEHEIGSHGGWHQMVTRQSRKEFKKDVLFSKRLLEDISGKNVELFRASSWSVSWDTLWALEILEEAGFTCDSSMQPFKTPLSGMEGIPVEPFYPVIDGRKLNILEFPQTVLKVFKFHIPFSGGFYLRSLPIQFISWALKRVNIKRCGMIYLHPWETDTRQPLIPSPPHIKLIHYLNLHKTVDKLDKLLSNHEFAPVGEVIKKGEFPTWELSQTSALHNKPLFNLRDTMAKKA